MRQRQADSDRIARAAASAGMLALIIVAKAGSRAFGYSFPNSLLVLLVLAAIGGAYLLFKRRERPVASGSDPRATQSVEGPSVVPPSAGPAARSVTISPAVQRVSGPAPAQHADPAAAVATVSAQAVRPNHPEPPTQPVHYGVNRPNDDPPTVGLGVAVPAPDNDPPTVGVSEFGASPPHADPPTVGLSGSAPVR